MRIRLFTIPNLLTLSNLVCGAMGVVAALAGHDLTAAFALMVAAAAFDFLDGFAARLLGQSGPLGVQLDSLADDVSFGLLPAMMLYVLYGCMPGLWLPDWAGVSVLVVAACAALRLAKFNIDPTQRTEFCGLPSPAAALLCASLGMLAQRQGVTVPREGIVAVAVAVSCLMVSDIRMFALKFHGWGWRENRLRYLFLGAAAVLAATLRAWAVPAIVALYVAVSTVRHFACRTAGSEPSN